MRLLAALLIFVCGCESAAPKESVPNAVDTLPSTDANAAGQSLFLFDTWGTEVQGEWPPLAFMLGLQKSEPSVFGNQYASYGFIPDPKDDLPIGLKRGSVDPTLVHETCAMCHVGKLPDGSIYLGLPNYSLDVGRFRADVNDRWVAAGNPPLDDALAEKKLRALGTGRFDAESGSYPIAVPADFPVYFTLSKRTHMNYLGTGGNVKTEASLSIYTFGAGDTTQPVQVPFPDDATFTSFLGFFGNIPAPTAPAGDATLIAQGQQVFTTARCNACHHVGDLGSDAVTPVDSVERIPGDDPAWPRGSIATDMAHRALVDDAQGLLGGSDMGAPDLGGLGAADMSSPGIDTGYIAILEFIGDHGLIVQNSDGYRVNDLRGLWATAPYLHNGSVPTLADLLNPPAMRPKTFMRAGVLVDTTQVASTNVGHTYGTTLAATDKTALIAYLNSL